jgi:hypothetical protein
MFKGTMHVGLRDPATAWSVWDQNFDGKTWCRSYWTLRISGVRPNGDRLGTWTVGKDSCSRKAGDIVEAVYRVIDDNTFRFRLGQPDLDDPSTPETFDHKCKPSPTEDAKNCTIQPGHPYDQTAGYDTGFGPGADWL